MAIIASFVSAAAADCTPHWDNAIGQPGMNSSVLALTVFDDSSGSGPALYAGGNFTTAGGVEVNYIAKWDGESWSALGSGVNSFVQALTVFDDSSGAGPALYAGGWFTMAGEVTVNRIAAWDGKSWSALRSAFVGGPPNPPNPLVHALTVFDDGSGSGSALYAGGFFTHAGGVEVNRIARWDGLAWTGLGASCPGSSIWCGMSGTVLALTVFDDGSGSGPALYAGGSFATAAGVTVNRIARWDGESWSALGSGMNGDVLALTVFDDGSGDALYAGGEFTMAGGVEVNRIARWDGETWSAVGSGVSHPVYALMVFDDRSGAGPALYAGGMFTTAGGVTVNRIARWDGESWSALGSGMDGPPSPPRVFALTVFDDGSGPALYAGGVFSAAGGLSANRIAKWRGCPDPGEPGIPGDLNGDGSVGVADLLILLSEWGQCADCGNCPADLTGDCNVGVADLLVLLSNWG